MMKTKPFHHGDFNFKAYCKPCGYGWEVGIMSKGEPLFVGNFVHKAEALKWWTMMCKEVKTFGMHYTPSAKTPMKWYGGFLSHHIYNCYYGYLGKVFTTHTKHYKTAFSKDVKKFKTFHKHAA